MEGSLWISFITLSLLEIVLGIDNVIFLSILTSRLPQRQQKKARFIGLSLAFIMRIALLAGVLFVTKLTYPLFHYKDFAVSYRDLILGFGGLFLLYKGTSEIHSTMEGDDHKPQSKTNAFFSIITQIVILDLVFSLDSVITAIGMTQHLGVMIAAISLAILVMLLAAESTSAFVQKHLSVKMLALSFLLLVGVALIADAMHFHIPRAYLYFAIAFSITVETLTLLAKKRRAN